MKKINDRNLVKYVILQNGKVFSNTQKKEIQQFIDEENNKAFVNLYSSNDRLEKKYYIDYLLDLTYNKPPWYNSPGK